MVRWSLLAFLIILLVAFIAACTPVSNTEVDVLPTSQPTNTTPVPLTPSPTESPIPATDTPMPTATQTETPRPSATPIPTETYLALPTNTPIPTATTPASPTPIPASSTPLPTQPPAPTAVATSSLPGNPLPLSGGSYNGCPLLSPGQYTTDPYGCDSCVRMDLANWTMASTAAPGASLQQVVGAYEQDGAIYLSFASGESINLSATNYRYIVVIVSLSRAIQTWEDSIDTRAVSAEEFLSVLGSGTTIGYINNPDFDTTAVRVAPICGE